MMRDPKYDVLFEPVPLGPKVLRNRLYVTPHCSGLGVDFPGAQAYLRAVRADGGWAAVHTEACLVTPECDVSPQILPRLCDDRDMRNLALMCERVHEHGALAGVQLSSAGPKHSNYETRLPARAVVQMPAAGFQLSGYTMSRRDIRDVQQAYVAAARRAAKVGFDIIQLSMREGGALPMQFLVSYWNKRTDDYGGTFENRARFARETLELIREAVGDECAITLGFCIDHLRWGAGDGMRVDGESGAFIELVDGLVDLWDLQVGDFEQDSASSRFRPQGWQTEWVAKVRQFTSKPIAGVGRFTDPDVMVDMIVNGPLDVIGAARPAIADPFLPKKIEEGRLDDIRECIGCNMCVSRYNAGGGRIICTQNATVGEEYRRGWHPERFQKARDTEIDVLVVGAGPAGMECARVLGERGLRRVHLAEADEELGGHLRWITTFRGLGEWARVVKYREAQLDKLANVEVLKGLDLDAEAVLGYGADIVILATGARWSGVGVNSVTHRPIPGVDDTLPYVLTPEQLMVEGKAVPGERVVVYDCEGYFMGASIAEKLALEGKQVLLATQHHQVAPYMFNTHEGNPMHAVLVELGVELRPNHVVTEVRAGEVDASYAYAPERPVVWSADAFVVATSRTSNEALYQEVVADQDELADAGVRGLYRVGDCLEPRVIADCIFDGHRLAREIDTDDPARPQPYIREHRILGLDDRGYDATLDGHLTSRPSSVLSAGPSDLS